MEHDTYDYFKKIDSLGGVIAAIDKGFFHREIADSAFRYQRETETGERTIVGVNEYVTDEPLCIPLLKIDPEWERTHLERLNRVRRERDDQELSRRLKDLENAARGTDNLMPHIIESVRAYGTLGEICDALRGVFGEYKAPALV